MLKPGWKGSFRAVHWRPPSSHCLSPECSWPPVPVPFRSPSESLFTPLISFEEGCQRWVWDAARYLNAPLTLGGSSNVSCPVSPASLPSAETLTPSGREDTLTIPTASLLLSAVKSLLKFDSYQSSFPTTSVGINSKLKWKTDCVTSIFKGGV